MKFRERLLSAGGNVSPSATPYVISIVLIYKSARTIMISSHPSAIHMVSASSTCNPFDDSDALRSFSGVSGMFHRSAIPSNVLDRPIMIPICASNRPNKSVALSPTMTSISLPAKGIAAN